MSTLSSGNKNITITDSNGYSSGLTSKMVKVKENIIQESMKTLNEHGKEVEEYDLNSEQIDAKSEKYNEFFAEAQKRSQKKRDELAEYIDEANKQIQDLQRQYDTVYDEEKYKRSKSEKNMSSEYANQIDALLLKIKNLERKQNEWQQEIDEISEYDRVIANINASSWDYESNLDAIENQHKTKQQELEAIKKLQEEYIRAYVYTYRKWVLSIDNRRISTANFPISATYTDENGKIKTIDFFNDTGDILDEINLYVEAGMENGYHIVLDKDGNYILKNGSEIVKTTDLKVTTFEDIYNPEDYTDYLNEYGTCYDQSIITPSPRDYWNNIHKNGNSRTLKDINTSLGIMDAKYSNTSEGFQYTIDTNCYEDAGRLIENPTQYFRGFLLNQDQIKEYFANFENYNELWTFMPSLTGDEAYDYFIKNGIDKEACEYYVYLLDTKSEEEAYKYLSDLKMKILHEQAEKEQYDYALENSLKEIYYNGFSNREDFDEVLNQISDKQRAFCDMQLGEYKNFLTDEEYNTYLYLMFADLDTNQEFFQKYYYVTQEEDFNEVISKLNEEELGKDNLLSNISSVLMSKEEMQIIAYLNEKKPDALSELESSLSKVYLDWKKTELNSRIGQKEAFEAVKDYLLLEEVSPEQLTSGSLYFVDTDENGNTIYYEAIGIKPGTNKTLMCADLGLEGFGDGVINFSEGMSNAINAVFNNLSDTPSISQYKQMYIIEILSKTDEETAQAFYEVGTSIGNMAIPMAASVVSNFVVPGSGEVVSSIMMGVSSGGNAALQAHMEGANYYQSLLMGVLSGGSEALIGNALGAIPGISNLEKFEDLGGFKSMLAKMASEGLEESVQSILEPIMHYAVFGDRGSLEMNWDEVAKSGFYGMITAGILNGGQVIVDGVARSLDNYIMSLSQDQIRQALDYYNDITGQELLLEDGQYAYKLDADIASSERPVEIFNNFNVKDDVASKLSDAIKDGQSIVEGIVNKDSTTYNFEKEIALANYYTRKGHFYTIDIDSFENIPNDIWSKIDDPSNVYFRKDGKTYSFLEAKELSGINPLSSVKAVDPKSYDIYQKVNWANYQTRKGLFCTIDIDSFENIPDDIWSKIDDPSNVYFRKDGKTYNSADIQKQRFNKNNSLAAIMSVIDAMDKKYGQGKGIATLYRYLTGSAPITDISEEGNFRQIVQSLDYNTLVYCYNTIINNTRSSTEEVNIKNEIFSKMPNGLNAFQTARYLYLELNKRLNYDANYLVGDSQTKDSIYNYNANMNFNNLNKTNKVVCNGWAALFRDLLIDAGFDPKMINIVGSKHRWIEIDFGDGIIRADATQNYDGMTDLAASKSNFSTNGFLYLDKSYSGYNFGTSIKGKVSEEVLNSNQEWLREIDQTIGYSENGSYFNEVIGKLEKDFYSPSLVEKIFGAKEKKLLTAKINKYLNLEVPENMDAADAYNYFRQIKRIIFGADDYMVSVSIGKIQQSDGNYNLVTTITVPNSTNGIICKIINDDGSTYLKEFNNFYELKNYNISIGLKGLRE